MSRRRTAVALALVLLLGFGLRLGLTVAIRAWEQPSFMEHRQIAINLLIGEGFSFRDWGYFGPSSVQSPPYPVLLALLYRAFGPDAASAHIAAMIINALAGTLAALLSYFMVLSLRGSKSVALLTAFLVAVWPTQVYAVTVVQAIALIIAGTVASIWLWYRAIDTQRLGPWIGFGIIGCLAALTEPVLLPAMALSGLLVLFHPSLPWPIRLRNAAMLLLIAITIIGPWTYRNWLVHGSFSPIKATFWVNVWKGNNPNASGTDRPVLSEEKRRQLLEGMTEAERRNPNFDGVRQYDLLSPQQREELNDKTEIERERLFAKYAKTWIRENPGGYAKMCLVRLGKTLWIEWDNPKSYRFSNFVSRTLLLALTPFGLLLAVRRGWRVGFPLLIVGTSLLTYTLTITAARFAIPLEPWQLALVALLAVTILERWFGPIDKIRGLSFLSERGAPSSREPIPT
jgi:4-amino-4-deoxy-L-arabinose transferase-like glycosyltransferase